MKDPIQPMGSNFDSIEPDLGVVIEEKGRQKRGQQAFSHLSGKISRQDYINKFNKTEFNFSSANIDQLLKSAKEDKSKNFDSAIKKMVGQKSSEISI